MRETDVTDVVAATRYSPYRISHNLTYALKFPFYVPTADQQCTSIADEASQLPHIACRAMLCG